MGLPLAKRNLAEFLAWEDLQTERHEFFRRETFAMAGGSARHNRVIMNLGAHIAQHVDGTECQVFSQGMKAQIAEGSLYPDVMVTCGKKQAGDEQVIKDPVLIIEVLSTSTKGYDKRDKFALYRTVPSLREYALIDPTTRQVEVFVLTDAGSWLFTDQSKAEQLALSAIDLTLPMAAVIKGVESAAL